MAYFLQISKRYIGMYAEGFELHLILKFLFGKRKLRCENIIYVIDWKVKVSCSHIYLRKTVQVYGLIQR